MGKPFVEHGDFLQYCQFLDKFSTIFKGGVGIFRGILRCLSLFHNFPVERVMIFPRMLGFCRALVGEHWFRCWYSCCP